MRVDKFMGWGVEEMEMLIDVVLQFLVELFLNIIGHTFDFYGFCFELKGISTHMWHSDHKATAS